MSTYPPNTSNSYLRGFTLIELLVLLSVFGILFALGVSIFARSRQTQALLAAQAQLSTDIERARSFSRRYSYNYRVTLTISTRSYVIEPITGTPPAAVTVVAGYPKITATLPSNIQVISTVPSAATALVFIYTGPYGRLNASNYSMRIGYGNGANDLKTDVDLVGVTGQVIRRGIFQ